MTPCQQEPVIKNMHETMIKMDGKLDMLLIEYWKNQGKKDLKTVFISSVITIIGLVANAFFK
jgi:hypothetical protein